MTTKMNNIVNELKSLNETLKGIYKRMWWIVFWIAIMVLFGLG
jgi:hypothetical protein